MKRSTLFASLACASLVSSSAIAHDGKDGEACHHPENAAAGSKDITTRGEALTPELLKDKPVVAFADLLKKPEAYVGKTIVTTGTIRQVCQKKGCWMELGGSGKVPGARVTFKDYAFFAPKDSVGHTAKLLGVVKVSELSEERAKHYEAEGATIARDDKGKPREIQIEASGMELNKKG